MNAIQFIKDHGVEKAREVVERSSFGTHYKVDTGEVICCHNENHFYFVGQIKLGIEFIRIDDLKRLVESVDLVKEHYTLDRAIEYANSSYTAPEIKVCLLDAIADYKSIYGGEHV